MRKSSKFIVVAGALAALAVPSAAMADAPTGTIEGIVTKGNAKVHENTVANNSARITQNGQWVGGHNEYADAGLDQTNPDSYWWTDQTTGPGSRGDYVQSLHLADGQGSLAN